MRIKLGFGFLAALAIALPASLPASAQDFPITRIESRGLGHSNIYLGGFKLIVPDTDTTRPAFEGSRLRRYDLHLAKMFEITDYFCRRDPEASQRYAIWEYFAANGSANMGSFHISCDLARDISTAYGLGRTERTVITIISTPRQSNTAAIDVPILQITGGKIDHWLNFTEGFTPTGQ